MSSPRSEDVLTLISRLELLDRLCREPAHIRDLIDETGQARSTVHRAVNELEDLGFVERTADGMETTISGRFARDQLTEYLESFADLRAAHSVLEPVPADTDIDVAVVSGAEGILATDPTPYRPTDRLHEDLTAATAYRALMPTVEESRTIRVLYEHVVTRGNPAELVVSPAVYRTLQTEFPRRMALLAETDHFSLFVGEVPPYTLGLLEKPASVASASTPLVHAVIHNDTGGIHGLLVNETDPAVSWATAQYDEYRAEATERTDTLVPNTDGGTRVDEPSGPGMIGRSLPVALEREGFLEVDAGYFQNEPVATPATAWRAGLSLTEVHTGYAIDRPVEGTDTDFAGTVADDLASGTSVSIIGPPGSGKSTICKQVACSWYEDGRGPVLYRASDLGRPFASTGDLHRTISTTEGHTLVVVEDAVRSEANAIIEVLDRLEHREDVSVLLDAREHEWNTHLEREGAEPPLEVVHMPSMDLRACERLVDHFKRTVGDSIDVAPDRLWSAVREEVSTGDEAAPNEMLRVIHRLATYADPLADGPTALEESVASTYESVAEDELTLSLSVLTHVLNAAGIAVDSALLYAGVRAESLTAVDEAIEDLDGEFLFLQEGGRYRAVHEEWSKTFLTHIMAVEGEEVAAQRFGTVVTDLLALADEPERLEPVANHLGMETATAAVVDDPGRWADETTRAIFSLAESNLSPLFGDGANDTIDLPAACSEGMLTDRPIWLGKGFLASGYPDRAERAFERLPSTASECGVERLLGLAQVHTDRGALEDAEETCRTCLTVIDDADKSLADPAPYRARTHLKYGKALAEHSQYAEAETQYQAVLDELDRTDQPRLRARTLHQIGYMALKQGEYDRSEERLQTALDLSESLGDRRIEAEVLNALGSISWVHGENDATRALFERTLELRKALGDRHGEGKVLYNLGILAKRKGQYETADGLLERSLELVRDVGDRQVEVRAMGALGDNLIKQGSYDRATALLTEWLDYSRAQGDRHDEARAVNNLGLVEIRRARYDHAREYFEQSLTIKEELGDARAAARTQGNLAIIAIRQGRFTFAAELLEERLDRQQQFDGGVEMSSTIHKLGVVATRQGDLTAGADHFERALELATETGESRSVAMAHIGLAEIARQEGAFDRAFDSLDAAAVTIEGVESTLDVEIQLARARVAHSAGEFDAARSHAEATLQAFESLGDRHWAARSKGMLGRIAADTGDGELARERLLDALDTFEEIGAYYDAMETVQVLVEVDTDAVPEEYVNRGRQLLSEAPEAVVDLYPEWPPSE